MTFIAYVALVAFGLIALAAVFGVAWAVVEAAITTQRRFR
jgi:hypothetical protein